MTEDFQAEVCGETWWNPTRNIFGSSPCLSGINPLGDFGTWLGHEVPYMKARSSTEESGSANQPDYDLDSSSRITGFGLSPPTESDWNGALMYGTRSSEPNHPQLLQQEDQNSSMNFGQEICFDNSQIHKDWSPNNFSAIVDDSFTNSFQSPDQEISSKPLNSFTKSTHFRTTTNTLPSSFVSYDNGSFSSPVHGTFSEALHTLFGDDTQSQQLLCVNESMDYNPMLYEATLNEFSVNSMTKLSSENPNNYLELSTVVSNGQSASQYLQFVPSSTNYEEHNPIPKLKAMIEEVHGLDSGAKNFSSEQIFKRPRIEAPTSLPTFKVRKEKLGDRVTALQQLVSPFGKTDTASVLHEAVEYIKFLHNQVNVLSSPYLKDGLPIQRLQSYDKKDAQQVQNQDLKSRGLCVVPISSIFPVAAENTTDFWTPNFGGTLR